MKNNFATTLQTSLMRAADAVLDQIAKDGVVALKSILDKHFLKNDNLKNYEVYGSVIDDTVEFEIMVDFDSTIFDNKMSEKMSEKENLEGVNKKQTRRTYGIKNGRVLRVSHDAKGMNNGLHDARKTYHDARKTSFHRKIEHQVALTNPRSLTTTNDGKISISLVRSLNEKTNKIKFPQGKFDGIMKNIMDEIMIVVSESFSPYLQKIISDYVE